MKNFTNGEHAGTLLNLEPSENEISASAMAEPLEVK